ncbi:hypothetical protein GOP47_0030294 [Adiantum capillus-veneris]|nr:hypothetical protein GOP47_0030294 [Adiantum capillus-veneris]
MVSNMKFDDAVLSSYIAKKLQPLTQADPNLLARYVTALLRNNQPKKELEALCIEKLFDFLGDESTSFVQTLFQAFERGTVPKLNDDCSVKVVEIARPIPVCEAARFKREAACIGVVTDGRSCSQLEKLSEADNVVSGDFEEMGSDDEDDNRNHKHRRRVSTSHSVSKVQSLLGFSPKEDDKPEINGSSPAYDDGILAAESLKGLCVSNIARNIAPKRVPHCDQAYASPSRHTRENDWLDFSTEGIHFRGDVVRSRSEHLPGHGRGVFAEPGIAPALKTALHGLDLNMPLPSICRTFNPYSGKPTGSRLNVSQSSWPGVGQFLGVRTGPHEQTAMGSTAQRSRCPDFEERGYCLRGDFCPMEHGANRIVVKDFQSLSELNLSMSISSGSDMILSTSSILTSSFTSHLWNPLSFTRDLNMPMVDDSYFSKGTLADNDFSATDLYDPDQPLFNTEQHSAFANGMKRLSSFRKDLEDNEGVLKRQKQDCPAEGRVERSSINMPIGLTQGPSVLNQVRHTSHDINSTAWKDLHSGDVIETEKDLFVESYEPEIVHEKNHMEEQEILVKSTSMKAGISFAPLRAGLTSHRKGIAGAEGEKAHRTLHVSCIPKIDNRKGLLNAHFQRFGEIVNIRIPLQGDIAFIQFSQREEAEAALRSPEAVMGNRFVRLSWAKRDNVPFQPLGSGLAASSTTGPCLSGVEPEVSQGLITEVSLTKARRTVSMSALSEANCFTTTAKSIIPSFQTMSSASLLKKQQDLERMMEELRRKQNELAHKRKDFRRQLERYSKQGFGVAAGLCKDQSSSISTSGSKAESNEDPSGSKQASLETLEAGINKSHKEISALSASIEEALLAADPAGSSVLKDPVKVTLGLAEGPISTRISQRGVKGSLVGTGVSLDGASQLSPMCCNLDNRSTAFHVVPPFPDGLVDVSAFTEHFSCFGDLSNVEVDDVNNCLKITFCTTSAAEKAFLECQYYHGTPLCFTWAKQSSSSTTGASSVDYTAARGVRSKEAYTPKHLREFEGHGSQADETTINNPVRSLQRSTIILNTLHDMASCKAPGLEAQK